MRMIIHRGGKKKEDGVNGENDEKEEGNTMELDDEKYHEEFRKAFQKQVYSIESY